MDRSLFPPEGGGRKEGGHMVLVKQKEGGHMILDYRKGGHMVLHFQKLTIKKSGNKTEVGLRKPHAYML